MPGRLPCSTCRWLPGLLSAAPAERYAHLTASMLLLHADFLDGPLDTNIDRLRYAGEACMCVAARRPARPQRVVGGCMEAFVGRRGKGGLAGKPCATVCKGAWDGAGQGRQ